jgi:signal transduction histidine kinase
MGGANRLNDMKEAIVKDLDQLHEQNRSLMRLLEMRSEFSVSLYKAIEDIRRAIHGHIEAKRILLRVSISPEVVREKVPSSINIVVFNLLMNALVVTPRRGQISLEAGFRGRALEISVTDSGPGVSASLIEKIWEPFFTTSDDRLGLGLFVCREWAKNVGAAVSLDLLHAPGARFTVMIPLRD